jgi:hypothetical protein
MAKRRKADASFSAKTGESESRSSQRKRKADDDADRESLARGGNDEALAVAPNQRVILNVGGKRFESYASTLRRHPKSALAGMYRLFFFGQADLYAGINVAAGPHELLSWFRYSAHSATTR